MPRTTLNLDGPILRDLKRLQKRERKPLGRIVSNLLARVLGQDKKAQAEPAPFRWISRPLRPRIHIEDKEALYEVLDGEKP